MTANAKPSWMPTDETLAQVAEDTAMAISGEDANPLHELRALISRAALDRAILEIEGIIAAYPNHGQEQHDRLAALRAERGAP